MLYIFTIIGNKEKLSYVLLLHFCLLYHESLFCFFVETISERVFLSTLFESILVILVSYVLNWLTLYLT